jgi:hypothetical protein
MGVLHGTFLQIVGYSDIVVRSEDQANSFASEELSESFHLLRVCFLFCDHVVEAEDHKNVRVVEDSLVDRELLSCLIDALVDGDGMVCGLADEILKSEEAEVKEL